MRKREAHRVVSTQTGQVWDCIKDAAKELSVNYNSLRVWVNAGKGPAKYL